MVSRIFRPRRAATPVKNHAVEDPLESFGPIILLQRLVISEQNMADVMTHEILPNDNLVEERRDRSDRHSVRNVGVVAHSVIA